MRRAYSLLLIAGTLVIATAVFGAGKSAPDATNVNTNETLAFYESLTVGDQVFTNAAVLRDTGEYVFVRHIGGLVSVYLGDMDDETLTELGYEPEDYREHSLFEAFLDADGNFDPSKLDPAIVMRLGMAFLVGFLVVYLVMHLLMSWIFRTICVKAGSEPGIMIWLPILQMIPIFRAANMSWMWLGASFILSLGGALAQNSSMGLALGLSAASTLLSLGITIAWCIRICLARGKSGLLSILLLLPGVNFFTLIYLAVSD